MSDSIARDYDLDDEIDASEPAQLKALGDALRMQICDLVLERAMSVTEIAERVDRPRGTIAYHVDVLVDTVRRASATARNSGPAGSTCWPST